MRLSAWSILEISFRAGRGCAAQRPVGLDAGAVGDVGLVDAALGEAGERAVGLAQQLGAPPPQLLAEVFDLQDTHELFAVGGAVVGRQIEHHLSRSFRVVPQRRGQAGGGAPSQSLPDARPGARLTRSAPILVASRRLITAGMDRAKHASGAPATGSRRSADRPRRRPSAPGAAFARAQRRAGRAVIPAMDMITLLLPNEDGDPGGA